MNTSVNPGRRLSTKWFLGLYGSFFERSFALRRFFAGDSAAGLLLRRFAGDCVAPVVSF
jgi:hypothetical protein